MRSIFLTTQPYIKNIDSSFDTISLINKEVTQVHIWINTNRLSLNVEETDFMLFSSSANNENVKETVNGIIISRVTSHKFLWVLI